MQYTQLRRVVITNNTGIGAPFVAATTYWDSYARTYYHTQTDSLVNDPAELAIGTEVDRWVVRAGKVRVVSYAGNGKVLTSNVRGGGVCTIRPAQFVPDRGLVTVDVNGNPVGPPDGYVKVFGNAGVPPYALAVTDLGGTLVASATRRTGTLPLEVFGLDPTRAPYTVTTTDAANCVSTRLLNVVKGAPNSIPYGTLLEDTYAGNGTSGGSGTQTIWNPVTKVVEYYPYTSTDPFDHNYALGNGQFVDGYLLADQLTFRTVRTQGGASIYFADSTLSSSSVIATLDNLILFHPDTAAEQNGGVLVEVNTLSAAPLDFTLNGTAGGVAIAPQTNQTGSFDGLAAGDYSVLCGGTLTVAFALRLRYGLRWALDFADQYGVPLRLELWLRAYSGVVETIYGHGANPVVLRTDGLSSTLGGQGDVPAVVGTACELNLMVLPGVLEEVLLSDDRACRCDVYRAGGLQFRGYLTPDVSTEPLLNGYLPLTVTATDGLSGMKDTDFLGHIGQRLQGRRPVLNTLLHALSRTDVSLPLRLLVNRRSTEMSDADAPELAATTDRNGYWDAQKSEPLDLRAVVDALAQLLGGTLCQREGRWQVRSALEALAPAAGRAYLPAGTPAAAFTVAAPAGQIAPFSQAATTWGWQDSSQQKQVRPGWKSLIGSTDAGWLKNAFPAGDVFSDRYAWLLDFSRLRPITGWAAGTPDGFPLVFSQAGQKGNDYVTKWPRAIGILESRYLVSPALPLVPAPESTPAYLNITANFLATTYLPTGAPAADSPPSARLRVVVVVDGQPLPAPLLVVVPLCDTPSPKPAVLTVPMLALPAGTQQAVFYIYPWLATALDLTKLVVLQYDPAAGYAAGDVIRYQATAGYVNLYQAKQQIYRPNSAAGAILPGAMPINNRAYDSAVTTPPGIYILYQGVYYQAKQDLYAPVPAPPVAPASDANWVYIPRADIADAYWQPLDVNAGHGALYVTSVGIELRPQQATWDGVDNFRTDGPAGTVRPTQALSVFHPDVPIAAGLFEGNRYAFSKAVALSDGSLSTAWARPLDLAPSPLFEANVYDALALRSGPAKLLTGTLRCRGAAAPLLLDAVDTPYDVPGRRFGVGASAWNLRAATTEVSLVEIGPGAGAPDPLLALPDGVRITHATYEYAPGFFTPIARLTQDGQVRVRH